MLVYGDHSRRTDPQERISEIDKRLSHTRSGAPGIRRHSQLVAALIDAGQVQQGVADEDFRAVGHDRASPATLALTRWVHAIAGAVCRSWDSAFREVPATPACPSEWPWPGQIEERVPEGYAFYALYPEAFIEAARRLRLNAPPRVIGIRSIGTSLGAVVAAALDAPPVITVRPHGDPFARRISISAELEGDLLRNNAHFVIVDEGPGQSGSSFGAVADWLQARGVPLDRIAFLPSHDGAPGPQASEAHRRRWRDAQRVPGDFGDALVRRVRDWRGQPADSLREITGGGWRPLVFVSESDWPPAAKMWERRKFLARGHEGTLLLKFAGLGELGERKLRMARALHAAGFGAEPTALVHGFLTERWVDDACPLTAGEKPLEEIARYIGARARLFAAQADEGASLKTLLRMIGRNVSLTLGDSAAAMLDKWEDRLEALSRRIVRVRTDNKLDRHEWLRSRDGRLLKTDAVDHHAAHDLVGCQDMAWDVAGAAAEFDLGDDELDRVATLAGQAAGRPVDGDLLAFYRIAYAAFRLGQASMAAQMCSPAEPDHGRWLRKEAGYRRALQLLLEPSSGATRPKSLVG